MKIILPEVVAVGIYNTDISQKNVTVSKKRKTTMFEIEIPLEDGGVSHINTDEAPIRTDTIICVKPGQLRHTRLPFKCRYIHMMVTSGELFDILTTLPDFIKTEKAEMYNELFKTMEKHFQSGVESDEIMLQSTLLELIYTLLGDSEKTKLYHNAKRNNHKVVEDTIKFIKENLTSDLSLKALSSLAGFSPIHFHKCFKASTGKTLRDFVEEQRIKKAVNMLISTPCTLTEIAYSCGFSSQSYFSYSFKRRMKLTPREYAEKISRKYENIN